MPRELIIVQLAEKFHQPFEYFDKLDVEFVNKLFIILKAENETIKEMYDQALKKNKK